MKRFIRGVIAFIGVLGLLTSTTYASTVGVNGSYQGTATMWHPPYQVPVQQWVPPSQASYQQWVPSTTQQQTVRVQPPPVAHYHPATTQRVYVPPVYGSKQVRQWIPARYATYYHRVYELIPAVMGSYTKRECMQYDAPGYWSTSCTTVNRSWQNTNYNNCSPAYIPAHRATLCQNVTTYYTITAAHYGYVNVPYQVLVSSGHYGYVTQRYVIKSGYYTTKHIPAYYTYTTPPATTTTQTVTVPGYYKTVYYTVPGHYETVYQTMPGYYYTVQFSTNYGTGGGATGVTTNGTGGETLGSGSVQKSGPGGQKNGNGNGNGGVGNGNGNGNVGHGGSSSSRFTNPWQIP